MVSLNAQQVIPEEHSTYTTRVCFSANYLTTNVSAFIAYAEWKMQKKYIFVFSISYFGINSASFYYVDRQILVKQTYTICTQFLWSGRYGCTPTGHYGCIIVMS